MTVPASMVERCRAALGNGTRIRTAYGVARELYGEDPGASTVGRVRAALELLVLEGFAVHTDREERDAYRRNS